MEVWFGSDDFPLQMGDVSGSESWIFRGVYEALNLPVGVGEGISLPPSQ